MRYDSFRGCQRAALLVLFVVLTSVNAGADNSMLMRENFNSSNTPEYWTNERMQNAKPFPIPKINSKPRDEFTQLNHLSNYGNHSEYGRGSPPLFNVAPDSQSLFTPIRDPKFASPIALDRGTLNFNFSSSRLVPLSADLSYPYSTVGKLFFTTPKGDFVCSASVLRPRVVLTAGHCVHSGSGGASGFYANFKFIPAYRDGVAPYKTWNWTYVIVTGTWAFGGGSVPNAADYAMIEVQDNSFGDTVRSIGSITGWLGWQTLSLAPNHAHLLGYPCNFDRCEKMHQVTAQSARNVEPNNVEYGSDMLGGSSGGPWVQNFGEFAMGQTGGNNAGLNRVIGVTSYLYFDNKLMAEGASIPDNRFVNILNSICAHRPGNC